jgi:hypothetical protein
MNRRIGTTFLTTTLQKKSKDFEMPSLSSMHNNGLPQEKDSLFPWFALEEITYNYLQNMSVQNKVFVYYFGNKFDKNLQN